MPSIKRKFGDLGEKIAIKYLENKHFKIIERNYAKPYGEIDIIALKNDLLRFFEVKTRDIVNIEHFLPEYSINKKKIRNIQKMCETYLYENKYNSDQKWQIDVISISIDKTNKKAKIKHIDNAIWERIY